MFHLPFPVRDANAAQGAGNLGDLPEWDLDDLYAGEDAPELKRDLDRLESACARFAADYKDKLAGLDAAGLLECVHRHEDISRIAGRIMSFAGLRYYQQTTDAGRAKFLSDTQEKITDFTTPLVFFTLELNRIDDAALKALFDASPDLARYRPAFERSLRLVVGWGFAVGAFVSVVVLVLGPVLIDLMTTSPDVRAEARLFLPYAALVPIAGTLAYQMDGVFIGATWSAEMRNMMLVSLAVYFAVWFVLAPPLGIAGLWIALLVFVGVRGVTLLWMSRGKVAASFPDRA